MLNVEPSIAITHTDVNLWHLRPAISFWAQVYSTGVRIVSDGSQFAYLEAWNWLRRLDENNAFGALPPEKPVTPDVWVVEGVGLHRVGLTAFLSQRFPKPYDRFAAHVLLLEYEVLPIEAHARRNGHIVVGAGVNGGNVLMYYGRCEPSKREFAPNLPPVLSKYRSLSL